MMLNTIAYAFWPLRYGERWHFNKALLIAVYREMSCSRGDKIMIPPQELLIPRKIGISSILFICSHAIELIALAGCLDAEQAPNIAYLD